MQIFSYSESGAVTRRGKNQLGFPKCAWLLEGKMNAFAHSRNVDNGIKIEIDKSNVYCPNHEGSVCFTRINGRNCCLLFSSAACQLVNLYKSNLARQDASAFCEMAKKSCLRMILATCQPKKLLGRFSSTCQLFTLYNFNLLRIDANAFCETAHENLIWEH